MITSLSDSLWAAARGFVTPYFLQCWKTSIKRLCVIETRFLSCFYSIKNVV